MEWLEEFPTMGRQDLRDLKKGIDLGFRDFSRAYGDGIEEFFEPLLYFLVWLEKLLVNSPWPIIIFVIAVLAWIGSRSWYVVVGTIACFLVIGYFGMWEDTMATLAIISVATLLCIAVGIPLGIWMARSDRVRSIITPVLDVMQTIPSFVYLIPIIMLLGIGKVPGLLAVCIYAMPPIVRLTNLGIRLVDKEVLEAAEAFRMLVAEAQEGYALLSRFRSVDALKEAGDTSGAVAVLEAIAEDNGVDALYRDLATLLSIMHVLDDDDPNELRTRLIPLIAIDGAWRHSARELSAALALRIGDKELAKSEFKKLADDLMAPSGVRSRAAEISQILGR